MMQMLIHNSVIFFSFFIFIFWQNAESISFFSLQRLFGERFFSFFFGCLYTENSVLRPVNMSILNGWTIHNTIFYYLINDHYQKKVQILILNQNGRKKGIESQKPFIRIEGQTIGMQIVKHDESEDEVEELQLKFLGLKKWVKFGTS